MEITFTADSGFLAVLKSFDMGGWPDADYDITSVQIWDGSGVVLYDSGPVTIEGAFDGGPRHTHFEFSPELETEVLRIRIDCLALGGACWNNGIDNVAYGQKQAGPTPPPAGVAPLADAGPDQPNVESGSDVNLDGSGSSDEDEDTLSFSWAFVSRPAGSTATLAGATTQHSRVPGSGVRGRGSGERETTASSLAGKEESSRKEDNSGQGKDGPAGAIAQGGNGR